MTAAPKDTPVGGQDIEARRKTFVRALNDADPKLAEIYLGTLHIVKGPTFPGRERFIAHGVRELRNGLPRTFAPPQKDANGNITAFLDHHKHLESLYDAWNPVSEALAESTSALDPKPTVEIPQSVAASLNDLIERDKAVSESNRRRFLAMCTTVNSESISWTGNESLAKRWMAIEAQRIAHAGSSEEGDEEALALFRELEEVALNIFDYAPERTKRVIALAEAATIENLKESLQYLVTLIDEYTFYGNLRNPKLLGELDALKRLQIPQNEPQVSWPPAEYLANIADADPHGVADTLIKVKTSRPGTIRGLTNVALRLPDDELSRVAGQAKWLKEPSIAFLENYTNIIKRMGEAGRKDIALKLSRRMLTLKPEPARVAFPGLDRMDAIARIGDDWFDHGLKQLMPIVRAIDQAEGIVLISDAVNVAVKIEGDDDIDPGYSLWFENFLNTTATQHDTKRILAATLAAECVDLAKKDLPDVLRILRAERNTSGIYKRIEYVCVLNNGDLEQALPHLLDGTAWVRGGPEHVALVEKHFPALPEDRRQEVAKAAFDGVTAYFEPIFVERNFDEKERAEIIRRNMVSRFGSAANAIPEPYQSQLQPATVPVPDPQREIPTLAEMEALSPTQLVEFLQSWLPEEGDRWPGSWSIGASMHGIFERNASTWLAQREVFNSIPLFFVGMALNAFQTYRRNNQGVDDERVLAVVEDSLARLDDMLKVVDDKTLSIAYHVAQMAGILLADIANASNSVEIIRRVVRAAQRLTAIPPDQIRRTRQTPTSAPNDANGDPHGLAVYAVAQALAAANRNKFDFGEIEKTFDDLTRDESLTVRAACGRFFNWFAQLFPAHNEEWAGRLFMSENVERNRAAWNGFVSFARANLNSLRLLRPAYVSRIAELAAGDEAGDEETATPNRSEGIFHDETLQHVWTLLANRIEMIGEPGSLAELMLDSASEEQIEDLLGRIGPTFREPRTPEDRNEMINAEALNLWDAVEKRVADGRFAQRALSALPLWLKAPLPSDWRFAKAEAASGVANDYSKNDWALVSAFIDLARIDRLRSLHLLEKLAQSGSMSAHAGIQMEAGPLLRSSVEGCNDDEKHLARSINSILVNNGRADMLSDLTVQIANAGSNDTDIPAI